MIAEGPVCLEVFFLHLPVASLRSRDLLLVLFLYVYVITVETNIFSSNKKTNSRYLEKFATEIFKQKAKLYWGRVFWFFVFFF